MGRFGSDFMSRSDILSLLRTYNCYHEGKNFQLRTHEVRDGIAADKTKKGSKQ